MNRLQSLFNKKRQDILSVYFTAGYPQLDDTKEIITTLAQNGVDMIEIGVPFSDPMADGVVIQESSNIALKNGMTLRKLLEQVGETRELAPTTPLILMGYLNPMMQYGINELFSKCSEIGIDAMIIPDLPFEDYVRDFKPLCDKYDIPIIMLITPETSDERIKLIDNHCDGFIYMVSSASTTGTRDRFDEVQESYFRRIAALQLKHQRLIGFGISNPATFATATSYSAGAIIGSLFIKCLRKTPENISDAVNQLLTTIGRK